MSPCMDRVLYWKINDDCGCHPEPEPPPPMVVYRPEPCCQPKIHARIMIACAGGRWTLGEIRTFNFPPGINTRIDIEGAVYVIEALYLTGSTPEGDEYEIMARPLSAYVTPTCPPPVVPEPPSPPPVPPSPPCGCKEERRRCTKCNPCGSSYILPVYPTIGYPY